MGARPRWSWRHGCRVECTPSRGQRRTRPLHRLGSTCHTGGRSPSEQELGSATKKRAPSAFARREHDNLRERLRDADGRTAGAVRSPAVGHGLSWSSQLGVRSNLCSACGQLRARSSARQSSDSNADGSAPGHRRIRAPSAHHTADTGLPCDVGRDSCPSVHECAPDPTVGRSSASPNRIRIWCPKETMAAHTARKRRCQLVCSTAAPR